jgi:hypothetical protein
MTEQMAALVDRAWQRAHKAAVDAAFNLARQSFDIWSIGNPPSDWPFAAPWKPASAAAGSPPRCVSHGACPTFGGFAAPEAAETGTCTAGSGTCPVRRVGRRVRR